MEIWKEIQQLENRYSISNYGNLRNNKTNKLLKQQVSKTGYYNVAMKPDGRNGKDVCFKIHRLVAEAFCLNPDNKPYVNHIDCNKLNNHYSNLEWVTHIENINHAVKNDLMDAPVGIEHPAALLNDEAVKFIRDNYVPYCKKFGAKPLAKKFGVDRRTIGGVVHKRNWKHVE